MDSEASNPPGIDDTFMPMMLDLFPTALASSEFCTMPEPNLESISLQQEPNPTRPDDASERSNSNQGQESLDANLNEIDLHLPESPNFTVLENEEFERPLMDFDFDDEFYAWLNNTGPTIGSQSGAANEEEHDLHEKGTSIEDDNEDAHMGWDGEDVTATTSSEKPKTERWSAKRKNQNKNAQKTFRARRKSHIKAIESKVEDLKKAFESTNRENERLRSHVERLNAELKEYKKRLSLCGTGACHPPAAAAFHSGQSWNIDQNCFQYAFPEFGGLSDSNSVHNGLLARVDSSPMRVGNTPASIGIPEYITANISGSAPSIPPTNANGSYNIGSTNYGGFQPSFHSQPRDYGAPNQPFRR